METPNGPEFMPSGAPKIPPRERSGRAQPPTGFEGMNYEQKRRPYKKGSDKEPGNENISHRRDRRTDEDNFQA